MDEKISAMPAASLPLTGTELVPLVQSLVNVQTTVSNLLYLFVGQTMVGGNPGSVLYLDASGLLTVSSALTYDGFNLLLSAGQVTVVGGFGGSVHLWPGSPTGITFADVAGNTAQFCDGTNAGLFHGEVTVDGLPGSTFGWVNASTAPSVPHTFNIVPGSTASYGVSSPTHLLTDPDVWLDVSVGGVSFRVPAYSA